MKEIVYCFISCQTGQTDKEEVKNVTNIITKE